MIQHLARLLTVKVAAITVALTATGGVALAATGTLPLPLPSTGSGSVTDTPVTAAPTPTPTAGSGTTEAGGQGSTGGQGATGAGTGLTTGQPDTGTGTTGPSQWRGLCVAATHGNALHNFGKAAQSAASARWITAAGGIDQLPAFLRGRARPGAHRDPCPDRRPEPAKRSRQRVPAIDCCNQLNKVSRTRSGVGRSPGESGETARAGRAIRPR